MLLLMRQFLDPEDIWQSVRDHSPFGVSEAIACCEQAFLRIALLKAGAQQTQRPRVADALCFAADAKTVSAFADIGDIETRAFYRCPLHEAALAVTRLYHLNAGSPLLMAALSVRRIHAPQSQIGVIAAQVENLRNEVRSALRSMRIGEEVVAPAVRSMRSPRR
jgi:hypothetical protein